MTPQELAKKIATLSPAQQEAVEKFIAYLQERPSAITNARAAMDAFMDEHAELMRLLAQ